MDFALKLFQKAWFVIDKASLDLGDLGCKGGEKAVVQINVSQLHQEGVEVLRACCGLSSDREICVCIKNPGIHLFSYV